MKEISTSIFFVNNQLSVSLIDFFDNLLSNLSRIFCVAASNPINILTKPAEISASTTSSYKLSILSHLEKYIFKPSLLISSANAIVSNFSFFEGIVKISSTKVKLLT